MRQGHKPPMNLEDFDFHLPETLIATRPARPRSSARLLLAAGAKRLAFLHVPTATHSGSSRSAAFAKALAPDIKRGQVTLVQHSAGGFGYAGGFEAAHITLTQGIHLGLGADVPEQLAARLAEVTDRTGEQIPQSGAAQGTNEVGKALAARV